MTNWQQFNQEIQKPDEQIDLAKAALLIAQSEYPNLHIPDYLSLLDKMATEVKTFLPSSSYPLKIIKGINQYLFDHLKFRGNLQNYYDPCNSFLNDVITRRKGIPISLSIIYLEIAKRINFEMMGIAMPGHFLIKPNFPDGEIFVDPFHQGEILFPQDCEERLSQVYQRPMTLQAHFLDPVNQKQILHRMLTNLKLIYLQQQQLEKALKFITAILMVVPSSYQEIRDRGLIYYQLGELTQARYDLENYVNLANDAQDLSKIRQLLNQIKSL